MKDYQKWIVVGMLVAESATGPIIVRFLQKDPQSDIIEIQYPYRHPNMNSPALSDSFTSVWGSALR